MPGDVKNSIKMSKQQKPGSKLQNVICYVALGSNLGDSVAYLNNAIEALKSSSFIEQLAISSFYKSKPHGPQDQPDYLNAVVRFVTPLKAEPLLDFLQSIEDDNSRVRKGVVRWGARTLDLDILFYGDELINTQRLTIPHPRICERAFVLLPLLDLHADLKIDAGNTIKSCINALPDSALQEITLYHD